MTIPRPAGARTGSGGLVLAGCLATLLSAGGLAPLAAQPLTERSPNLQGTWITAPRSLHFQFSHRFRMAGGDVTDLFGDAKVLNYPTFETSYGLFRSAMVGFRYSSNSLVGTSPNEWQPYLKVAPRLSSGSGAPSLSLQAAWNGAARSLDGEVAGRAELGSAFVLGSLRGFTDFWDIRTGESEGALALAGGVGYRINPYVTLAADVADVVAGPDGTAAWSAGVHVGIPYTPHTFSVMATNVTSGTIQGTSAGVRGTVFWGFEFTVPFSGVARWGRIFTGEELREEAREAPLEGRRVVEVAISSFSYGPTELRVPPGTTVRWVNRDPLAHTATADDGSWGSPLFGPGETFERRFDEPGRYPYHCAPHPFMEAVVVVTEAPRERPEDP